MKRDAGLDDARLSEFKDHLKGRWPYLGLTVTEWIPEFKIGVEGENLRILFEYYKGQYEASVHTPLIRIERSGITSIWLSRAYGDTPEEAVDSALMDAMVMVENLTTDFLATYQGLIQSCAERK